MGHSFYHFKEFVGKAVVVKINNFKNCIAKYLMMESSSYEHSNSITGKFEAKPDGSKDYTDGEHDLIEEDEVRNATSEVDKAVTKYYELCSLYSTIRFWRRVGDLKVDDLRNQEKLKMLEFHGERIAEDHRSAKASNSLKSENHELVNGSVSEGTNNTNIKEDMFAFCANEECIKGREDATWIVDSGATCHIANSLESFIDFDSSVSQHIGVANGKGSVSKGIGVCKIRLVHNGQERHITVKDVHYLPDFTGNLLSVRKLTSLGFTVTFTENAVVIKKGDITAAKGHKEKGLYVIQGQQDVILSVSTCTDKCIHFWHRVFGHRDPNVIKQTLSDNDIKAKDCGIRRLCEPCMKGKFTHLPFPQKSETMSENILDLVHTDVCGPMQTSSVSGKLYFLTIIDDYSRYCKLYLLKYKSEVFDKFQEYLELVKNQHGRYPKVIRSDRGKEYVNRRIKCLLKEKGIELQLTTPYNPPQNGVAERKNRSLVEMGRCMLFDANMEKRMWGEAVVTANHIQNCLPTKGTTIEDAIPIELWKKVKPDLSKFRIFGSKAYVFVPKQKRRKWDEKSREMTFVGYDQNSKAYRMVDLNTMEVQISRDVRFEVFNERNFPTEKKSTSTPPKKPKETSS